MTQPSPTPEQLTEDTRTGACIVCAPAACCRPIVGVHTSHPGPAVAAEAVGAR